MFIFSIERLHIYVYFVLFIVRLVYFLSTFMFILFIIERLHIYIC